MCLSYLKCNWEHLVIWEKTRIEPFSERQIFRGGEVYLFPIKKKKKKAKKQCICCSKTNPCQDEEVIALHSARETTFRGPWCGPHASSAAPRALGRPALRLLCPGSSAPATTRALCTATQAVRDRWGLGFPMDPRSCSPGVSWLILPPAGLARHGHCLFLWCSPRLCWGDSGAGGR